jgi:polyisoprenyl-teichoic acid--peptidoglycan teichoic acid transferase
VKKRIQETAAPAAVPFTPVPRRRQKHRHRTVRIVLLVLCVLLVVVSASSYVFWRAMTSKINIIKPGEETLPSEYNIPTESLDNPLPNETGIRNILLLGVDTRDATSYKERSDSMMILTIDYNNKRLKLTSLQRDMLVYLPGKSEPVKLNAANAFGGPTLTLRAIRDNMRLDIQEYMIINMYGMEKLVDLAGGVMIDVTNEEVQFLNEDIAFANANYPDTPAVGPISKAGLQLLNGRQAVAYARIRKLDSDYGRMARQRTVMQALLDAFMDASLSRKASIAGEGLSLITTNISAVDLTTLAMKTVPMLSSTIDQLQIPIKGYFYEDSRATWVNRCDFNGMIPLLQEFIFGKTYPFDPVKEIPGAPHSSQPLPTVETKKTSSTTADHVTKPSGTETTQTQTSPSTTATTVTTTATETTGTTEPTSAESTSSDSGTSAVTETTTGTTATTASSSETTSGG